MGSRVACHMDGLPVEKRVLIILVKISTYKVINIQLQFCEKTFDLLLGIKILINFISLIMLIMIFHSV